MSPAFYFSFLFLGCYIWFLIPNPYDSSIPSHSPHLQFSVLAPLFKLALACTLHAFPACTQRNVFGDLRDERLMGVQTLRAWHRGKYSTPGGTKVKMFGSNPIFCFAHKSFFSMQQSGMTFIEAPLASRRDLERNRWMFQSNLNDPGKLYQYICNYLLRTSAGRKTVFFSLLVHADVKKKIIRPTSKPCVNYLILALLQKKKCTA